MRKNYANPIRILLLHGICTDGESNVDLLGDVLAGRGYDVKDIALKPTSWYNGRSLRLRNENLRRIRQEAWEGDHIIAHSNGCRLAYNCLQGGDTFGHMFWFAPALNRNVPLRKCGYQSLTVWHNPFDNAIWWARLLPDHIWGAMGRTGYMGPSSRVENVEVRKRTGYRHSHYFFEPHITQAADFIDRRLSMTD
jgi:hypothetical protein